MIEYLADFPTWASSALSFLVGLLGGHWLGMGRDDRNRRAAVFERVRSNLSSLTGNMMIGPADRDAILHAARPRQRRRISAALSRCDEAAQQYYCNGDDWGGQRPSIESEGRMAAAKRALAITLRV